jgi:ATP-dependent exoDNAse (exonuclease V) beta subunit
MSEARVLVVRASAGTGKTFLLAHRYLGLLFGGAKPEEILATTFTRKAAGEIIGRILTRLAQAALDGNARREMLNHLSPQPAQAPSAEDCQRLLHALLARLHAFQVRTLDAWFAHLARMHCAELGLPPAWGVMDQEEEKAQVAEEVGTLIAELPPQRLHDLVRDLQEQEFDRGVHAGLAELVGTGLTILRDSTPDAWDVVAQGAAADPAAVERLRADLRRLEVPATRNWPANLEKLRAAAAAEDWAAWLSLTPVKNLRTGNGKFDSQPILGDAAAVLHSGTAIAEKAFLHERWRRLQAAHALLAEADRRIDIARRAAGAFGFDDLPRWLQNAAALGDADDAAFRLDGRLHHVLLDEFQDTATPQWRALRPLVDAALGASGTLFCVGDGKQSIYGWRSGEPRLLGALAERYRAETAPLAQSFRSAQAILDAVNTVFRNLPQSVPGWKDGAALEEAAARFAGHWNDHTTARAGLPGRFELWAVPAPGDHEEARHADKVHAQAAACAAEIVAELRAAGHLDGEVAILVRTNEPVGRIVADLRARGIEASAEGNVPLTDSTAVCAALAALDVADRPDDTASARLTAVSPLADALGAAADLHARGREAARVTFAARVRTAVLAHGFGRWLARLHASPVFTAGGPCAGFDARRFARLVEAGHAWDLRARTRSGAALRLSAFTEHVRTLRLEDPAPAAVRVMTVHKSKGLEFDAVVLALTGGKRGKGPAFWTRRDDPEEPLSGVTHAGNKDLRGLDARLDALESATDVAGRYDAFCVLYVAMTRAKQRLEIVIPEAPATVLAGKDEERERAFSLAGLLRTIFQVTRGSAAVAFHASGAERGAWAAPATQSAEPPSSVAAGQAWPESTRVCGAAPPPVLPRWTASRAGKDVSVKLRALAAEPREDTRARGVAIHKLFEQCEWIEDFVLDEAALLAALRDLDDPPAAPNARRWIAEFHAMLQQPQVRIALTRPAGVPREHLTVWRERRFAVAMPEPGRSEPALLRGSFDRVILTGPRGAPASALILDFKTGGGMAGEPDSRTDPYVAQMGVYRAALARMLPLPEAAIRCGLLFVDSGMLKILD